MGYSTQFKGHLKFNEELTASKTAFLSSMLGEDCREHPEWKTTGLYYIDLKLLDDFSGLEWDGSEKTYDMDKLVNVVIDQMREKYPGFGLNGKLSAQGEEVDDRWELIINTEGKAEKRELKVYGQRIKCPHCEEEFVLED